MQVCATLYFLTKRKDKCLKYIAYFKYNIEDQIYINKWKSLADMHLASGRGWEVGVGFLMQDFSFMFWVLQTAVKMICFELMHTVPVHSGTFKWIGVRDSI